MMPIFKYILEFIVYLLSIYGAFSLFVSLIGGPAFLGKWLSEKSFNIVLMVKNVENVIEGLIRSMFIEDTFRNIISSGRLFVIDMGSSDRTYDILQKLSSEYGSIEVLKENEKDRVFEVFS